MPFLFIGIIGTGFLFTFYDVFDINVSFIQTCVALKPGCTAVNALTTLRVPVALNLAGYVVGTLVLSPLSDRIGRRNMLMVTMLLTGIGSLYTALAPDYTNFVLARVVTGMGVGADLAVINTFVGEVAPRRNRAKWISVIFINSSLGALLGVWLGLVLTTPSAPWPNGLPFAQAGPGFTDGWRWMYAVGALLALVAILLRVRLPESPRWLVGKGRLAEADAVVSDMEKMASRHGPLAAPSEDVPVDSPSSDGHAPYATLLGNRVYLLRVLLLLSVWFLAYITVFCFGAGFTSLLTALKYPPPAAGVIVASPATAPVRRPRNLGLRVVIQSIASHAMPAKLAARSVFTNATAVTLSTRNSLPALKPYHPNQSSPVPRATRGIECGPRSTILRRPTYSTDASAAMPAMLCTTMPPAKSSTPQCAMMPPPQIMCTNGKYTSVSHAERNSMYAGKRTRLANAPVMSAGVMIANIIW